MALMRAWKGSRNSSPLALALTERIRNLLQPQLIGVVVARAPVAKVAPRGMAGTFSEHEARATLSHMAEVWLRLAERQPTQPVFQQQQQVQPEVSVARQGWPNTDPAMPSHKFHVGESVILIPSISRNVSGGIYQVTKQLPPQREMAITQGKMPFVFGMVVLATLLMPWR
jgi:hypothetical protein